MLNKKILKLKKRLNNQKEIDRKILLEFSRNNPKQTERSKEFEAKIQAKASTENKLNKTQEELDKLEAQAQTLSNSFDTLQIEVKEKARKLDEGAAELEKKQKYIADLIEKTQELSPLKKSYSTKIEDTNNSIFELNEKIQEQEEAFNLCNAQISEAGKVFSKKKEEALEKAKASQELLVNLQIAQARLGAHKELTKELSVEIEQYSTQTRELKSSIDLRALELKRLEKEIEESKEILDKHKSIQAKKSSELKQLDKELSSTKASYDKNSSHIQNEMILITKKNYETRSLISIKTKELNELKFKFSQRESILKKKLASLEGAQKKKTQIESEYKQLREEERLLTGKLAEANTSLKEAMNSLRSAQSKKDEIQTDIEQCSSEIERIQSEILQTEGLNHELTSLVPELRKKEELNIAKMEESQKALNLQKKAFNDLTSERDQLEEKVRKSENKISSLEQELRNLKKECELTKEENKHLMRDQESKLKRISELAEAKKAYSDELHTEKIRRTVLREQSGEITIKLAKNLESANTPHLAEVQAAKQSILNVYNFGRNTDGFRKIVANISLKGQVLVSQCHLIYDSSSMTREDLDCLNGDLERVLGQKVALTFAEIEDTCKVSFKTGKKITSRIQASPAKRPSLMM